MLSVGFQGRNEYEIKIEYVEGVSKVSRLTPPRTPRISRLKSQTLKPTFLS